MKFESLFLDKFGYAKILRVNELKGGVAPQSPIPNGGSGCSTAGGSKTINNHTFSWTADVDIYNAGGELIIEAGDCENFKEVVA